MSSDPAYNPERDVAPENLQYGAVDEAPRVNARAEDAETAKSEATGRIPKREIDDLRANGAQTLDQRTRYSGRGNDAYKQERELDEALYQEGGRDLVDDTV